MYQVSKLRPLVLLCVLFQLQNIFLFQGKLKELSLLCFVKDVVLDATNIDDAVKELR